MYSGFGNNVGVQAVAEVDWVDVITLSSSAMIQVCECLRHTIQDRCT